MITITVLQKLLSICAIKCLLLGFAMSQTCSFETCPNYKFNMINVHLVCHTHDDSGWLKTVDQYYWGANQSITTDGVQYILNTLFPSLEQNPSRKFSYCESNYFWRWWNQQDDATKQKVINFVNQGQLEFIGGGWVQHDEATTHYAAMIDQMTTGHRFLNETFGRCGIPRIGWQIDPFGHSRESASLMAQMGFDALFFARIHYADRNERFSSKSLQMFWDGSDDLGDEANIFTGVFFQSYSPPGGFCFDESCGDEPIMDDKRLEGYNVDEKVFQFIEEVKVQAKYFATDHIMLTMGSDFQYKNANQWFVNLDKLIKYVNDAQKKGSRVNVFYSTPTCYAKALMESGYKFPVKSDDFFPYASSIHSYWTGFFTSRPALKGFVRSTNNLLQVCQSMIGISQIASKEMNDVDTLRQAFGIVQHHDAVSGTAKQHVTNDYEKMLYEGIVKCERSTNVALNILATKSDQDLPINHFCTLLNISVCNTSQSNDNFFVTSYNSMAKQLNSFARIPVDGNSYKLFDPNGNEVQAQIVETFATSQINDPNRSTYQIVFPIELHPLGFNTYFITKDSNFRKEVNPKTDINKHYAQVVCTDCVISNKLVTVTFNSTTGLVSSIFDQTSGVKINLTQNFYWYRGTDPTMPDHQASGAYVFRPDGTSPYVVSTNVTLTKIGNADDYVQEMRQTFGSWVTQIVRVYQGKPYVEFEWTVGPIPCSDGISREVISRYDSDIMNDGTFYTDANGRQMMTRKLDYQPTYNYENYEPISGNYYPINTRIFVKDDEKQLTVLTDRSEGGSSLVNGSIEIMLHRRDLYDDGYGVNEPLNETGVDGRGLVVMGKHWLLLSTPQTGARRHRTFAQEMFYQPSLTFASTDDNFGTYSQNFKTSFSSLTKPLPSNVNFLTLSQWKDESHLIVRFEHLYQKSEDSEFSKPVTIDLEGLFTTFDVKSMTETSLTVLEVYQNSTKTSDFTVTLNPMQIRTFLVEISNRMS